MKTEFFISFATLCIRAEMFLLAPKVLLSLVSQEQAFNWELGFKHHIRQQKP